MSIPPTPNDEERAAQKKKKTRETIKFVVEVSGVIVLIVYTGATVLTYLQISDSARQTAEQFRAEQRAWIAVTVNSEPIEIGKPFKILLEMKNSGKTAALDTRICKITDFVKRPFKEPQLRECSEGDWRAAGFFPSVGGATLPDFVNPSGVKNTDLTEADVVALIKPDVLVWYHGRVTYTDIFGCKHWVTFCEYGQAVSGEILWGMCESGNDVDRDSTCKK